mmetsp:Transcript_27873/g.70471  ORF Transcript_27873/g.70471 Transcript_27873/m.70471 type:complete len:88 (-) Transcript_27873:240-503(-)
MLRTIRGVAPDIFVATTVVVFGFGRDALHLRDGTCCKRPLSSQHLLARLAQQGSNLDDQRAVREQLKEDGESSRRNSATDNRKATGR